LDKEIEDRFSLLEKKLGIKWFSYDMTTTMDLDQHLKHIKTQVERIEKLEKWNRQALDNNEVNTHDIDDNIKRIEKLEKKLSDFFERFDNRCIDIETIIGLNHKSEVKLIKPYKERIEKLESKIFHDYGGDLNKIEDAAVIQIELVKKVLKLEEWQDKSWNMHQEMAQEILPNQLEILEKQISELKAHDLVAEFVQYEIDGIFYTIPVASFRQSINEIKEVLREHLKSHIVVARDQLTNKDKMTIFKEFDEAIEKQLEKLEGKDADFELIEKYLGESEEK